MNTVTVEQVETILENAQKETTTHFGKTTIVLVKLDNGFVITESSSCVDPANYSEQLGYDVCIDRIKNKIWELEGYKLQCEIHKLKGGK